jgi:S1-C subfamily serine protease
VDTKGSCANSGLQKDDILLTFDGQKITSNDMIGALLAELTKYTVGMQVEITYYSRSKGTTETSTITLKSN